MPSCCTLYKGLLTLVIIFIIMQYLFGTIQYKSWESVFSSTNNNNSSIRSQIDFDPNSSQLLKAIMPKKSNYSSTLNNAQTTIFATPTIEGTTPSYNLTKLSDNLPANFTTANFCPENPPDLGTTVKVFKSNPASVYELEKRFDWLLPGGHWQPQSCQVTHKVAVIVPFRDRAEHLLLFLQHIHPFLKRQQLDYRIFVLEQEDEGPFNRAMLMNIGYVQALKVVPDLDCFIFHDVDLLPEDERNLYTCPAMPRHMSVAVDVFHYALPYRDIFGGVSAITREHFKLLNGFSNSFWGWGGEDDDMSNRIRYHNLFISRYPKAIARYTMLSHKKEKANPQRYDALKRGKLKYRTDGLNSLRYTVSRFKENRLYTWFLVNIKPNR